jgi:hypothetical protein
LKISFARRVNSAGGGIPAGKPELGPAPGSRLDDQFGVSGVTTEAEVGSLVLMVLSYVYIFEQGNRIVHENRRGAVQ